MSPPKAQRTGQQPTSTASVASFPNIKEVLSSHQSKKQLVAADLLPLYIDEFIGHFEKMLGRVL